MDDNKILIDFEENGEVNIEKIIKTYNVYIYTILKNSINNEEDIQEILSDVFFILWKKYDSLDKNLKIKPYLIGIVRNLIKKKYKQYNIKYDFENFEVMENQITSDFDIDELLDNYNKIELISEIMKDIPPQEEEIFVMFYYHNKKIKDIAKILNISVSKTKVTLHRLRKLVKKRFKERGYSYGQ